MLFALALLAALVVAGQMMPLFDPLSKRTPLSCPAVLAVFAGLAGLLVTSLRMALIDGRDAAGPVGAGRQLYVYLAELLLLLLFVNARLNVPALFGGGMVKYWPLFVMLLAFVRVGLSELFEPARPGGAVGAVAADGRLPAAGADPGVLGAAAAGADRTGPGPGAGHGAVPEQPGAAALELRRCTR